MPLTTDNLIASGQVLSPSGTSHTISHPSSTTEGSTVLVFLNGATGFGTITPPAGWETDSTGVAYRLSNVAGGVTSWTFTTSGAAQLVGHVVEVDGLALVDPLDALRSNTGAVTNGGTVTGTATPLNAGSQCMAFAVANVDKATATNTNSWSGWTNSFVELSDLDSSSHLPTQGVAWRIIDAPGTYSTAVTRATTDASATASLTVLLYRAADASINAPLDAFTGYEYGTHAGFEGALPFAMAPSGVPAVSATATWGTTYQVVSRYGGYALKWVQSAAVRNMPAQPAMTNKGAFSFDVEMESGSGTPIIATVVRTQADLYVRYDFTNTKFGVEWEGGSTVWQTGTTPLGTQATINFAILGTGSIHKAAWWISTGTGDGTQTAPTDLSGLVAETSTQLNWSSGVSATFTCYFDDVVQSRLYAAHPLTPHSVVAVVPEPTGATVSGTAANFNRFTANGTLAAVNGTEGALLDERPPTVSASADGAVQVTLAASDYLNLPMQNPTLAFNEIIAGVRFVAALWSGTGTGTGTLGWRGWDGLTETTFITTTQTYDADSLTAISSTYPLWVASMWSGAANGAWTPTRLNAAAIRMGFSTDATPDMGATMVMLEVATRTAPTVRTLQTLTEAADFTADIAVNPYNSATVSYIVTNNDPAKTATFNYSVAGVPQAPVMVGPSSNTTVDIHADNFGDITDVALTE
jgi:hypothetical protein